MEADAREISCPITVILLPQTTENHALDSVIAKQSLKPQLDIYNASYSPFQERTFMQLTIIGTLSTSTN